MPLSVPPKGNEHSESGVMWGTGELMLPSTRLELFFEEVTMAS